ncbi:hypothetical protein [Agrobacterium tumefaciens]|uniref:hypothetical protein n=1 Tax=Agrobacterium tumefaciens TaxID=358 RepID=UPI001F486A8A|nr:hypothetical protein [Agrobacterium tumefaciens]
MLHIKTKNDNELVDVMSDAMLRVGEGCTVTALREWFTSAEITRCGPAAINRAYDKRVLERRAA